MDSTGNIIELQNVSCGYGNHSLGLFKKKEKKTILHDVNLSIQRNEFYGLVGESGSGKSTLAKCILGLVPFSGNIILDGISLNKDSRINRKQKARLVQVVFQDPASCLDPKRTIGQTVQEPLYIHNIGNRKQRYESAVNMLEMVGLDPAYMHKYPHELSGGQRQRVCIGTALILKPKFLIADEAVSALDVSVGSQILNLFVELHRKMEFSMLFISHNLDVVNYLCDKIAVMNNGYIVESGKSDQIYSSPREPYTKTLLASANYGFSL